MLRIATDSSVDMPEEWKEQFDIAVIPVNINFGNKTFMQGIDINYDRFYQLVEELKIIPKTSLPSIDQFISFYRRIANAGDTILSIHVGGKLSGTFETAQAAARCLEDQYHVIPFDSDAGSAVLGLMCREARLMNRKGASVADILSRLEQVRRQVAIVFSVDRLDYARLSGRISAIQAFLSSALQIKPIIVLKDGLLVIREKVRTRQGSLERILDLIREHVGSGQIHLAVMHAKDFDTGTQLFQKARQVLNCKDSFLLDLSISVASHLGPGAVGIIAYPLEMTKP